ncbi:unnamed protein product, partial [Musa textilis]
LTLPYPSLLSSSSPFSGSLSRGARRRARTCSSALPKLLLFSFLIEIGGINC